MLNKESIDKIKDYADCADASYAMLHYVFENIDAFFDKDKWFDSDKIILGDKIKTEIKSIKDNEQILYKVGDNTAYAHCIEARFMQNKIIEKGIFMDSTINNNPKNVLATDKLSQRTINFVNRFKLLAHQPNTASGFSATLFYDTQKDRFVVGFRGTEWKHFLKFYILVG